MLGSDAVFSVSYLLTSEGRIISRTVYSIIDWLGDIGGIYGTFTMFFAVVIGWYNDKVFKIEAVISNFRVRSNPISKEQTNLRNAKVLGISEVAQLNNVTKF
jgi:hypothetical protein